MNNNYDHKQIIHMVGIKKIYQMNSTNVEALGGVDISIEKNEFVAILGPSGSGKSTLMYIMGCLDTPSEGEYYLEGQNVQKLNHNKLADIRNKKMGFIFQNYNLLPYATALENVELPMIYNKVVSKKRKQKAKELLDLVGLGNRINHTATSLSGGEMQRVAIARALVNSPSIILADEPTGNLDSKTGKEVFQIFENLWENGYTIVIITHDQNIASRSKRQIQLQDGMIIT
jgi:putative ABC transport system ATP-binding protein